MYGVLDCSDQQDAIIVCSLDFTSFVQFAGNHSGVSFLWYSGWGFPRYSNNILYLYSSNMCSCRASSTNAQHSTTSPLGDSSPLYQRGNPTQGTPLIGGQLLLVSMCILFEF